MDFEKAKEQSKQNEEQMLIKGYYSLIDHLNSEIQNAIESGRFFVRINVFVLKICILDEGDKADDNTIKAVIHHYKNRGANAYLEIEEGYRTETVRSFRQEHLVIDWSGN
ncbi:hypothetical protein NTB88_21965 [Aeromonas salmonicida]|nr:hypothetical protein [Aeromonas salmonicida]